MARTCRLLRSQEPLRAPRNFTLTLAMVGGIKPAPPPTYPVFGFVSAMAALLLILVLAGDWLNGRGVFLSRPEAVGVSDVMLAEQPLEAMAVQEEAPEAQPLLEMAVEAQVTATQEMALAAPGEQPATSAKSAPETSIDESARNMAPPPGEGEAAAVLPEDADISAETAAGMGASDTAETYPYPDIYPYPEMETLRSAPTLLGIPRPLLTVLEVLLAVAAVAFLVLFLLRRA